MSTTAIPNASVGLTSVQTRPTTAEAMKSPADWIPAKSPKAEPRNAVGSQAS